MKHLILIFILSPVFLGCAQQKQNDITISTVNKNYTTEVVVPNLQVPWAMAWLPDMSMLITERNGDLIHFKNGQKTKVQTNLSDIYVRGQGGLLDIILHPDYENNGWIYFSYASSQGDDGGGNTKLIRAKLQDNNLTQIETLYKAIPNTTRGQHFGSRIVFDNNGYLFLSIGDRGNHDQNPQDLTRDGGKIYRFNDDGSIPSDNPFFNVADAKKAVFSYGHRNPQGMTLNPKTGKLWSHEHGPQGGDEINIIEMGRNYGWPLITYGIDYDGSIISDKTENPKMEQPIYYWTPSIAPSGMMFVTSDKYPDWKGHLLVGSLKFQYLELVKLDENEIIAREKVLEDIGRLRDVRQGPDGYIYAGVEGIGIVKIIPKK